MPGSADDTAVGQGQEARPGGIWGRRWPWLGLAVLWLGFMFTGTRALDSGWHWDERNPFRMLQQAVGDGSFLPGEYSYGSFGYHLVMLAAAPELVEFGRDYVRERPAPAYRQPYTHYVPEEVQAATQARLDYTQDSLRWRARLLHLLVASLTGVWVFLTAHQWGRSAGEALFSAALVLTSWEFAYHARWVAPDLLQAQWTALFGLLLTRHLQAAETAAARRWLAAAAVVAGLACSTKYQGGILLLAVLGACFWPAAGVRESWGARLAEAARLGGLFVLAFLVMTPGALFEPILFAESVRYAVHQYATGHLGYSVAPGWEHAAHLLPYLGTQWLSHFPVVAGLFAAVALLGLPVLGRQPRRQVVLFLLPAVAYLLYMLTQRVMVVRNYFLLLPFVAVLGAFGVAALRDWLTRPLLQRAGAGLLGLGVALNLIWQFQQAAARGWPPEAYARQAAAHVREHPSPERLYLSPARRADLLVVSGQPLPATATRPQDAAFFLYYNFGGADPRLLPANRRGRYRPVGGAGDINFDYYPTWKGSPQWVEMDLAEALQSGLLAP